MSKKDIFDDLDYAFGYLYEAYVQRWHEQGLTGHIDLSVNFFKGGISASNYADKETKKPDELRKGRKFSTLKHS